MTENKRGRGRPKLKTSRKEQIFVRLLPEEKKHLEAAAKLKGKKSATIARELILEGVKTILKRGDHGAL